MLNTSLWLQDGDVYGPVELAEYILKTGDQEMVVNFLQHQMDVGKVSNWACVNPRKSEGTHDLVPNRAKTPHQARKGLKNY